MKVLLAPALALLLPACTDGGSTEAPAGPPDGMVHIEDTDVGGTGGYWIDRYEYPNQVGQKPLVYVDLKTAEQKCADDGKRLCTAAEWRRACVGPDGTQTYAYGPAYQPRMCHTEGILPSGHTSIMEPDKLIAESGAFPSCASAEGVVDLIGNAEEWVLDDWRGLDGVIEGGAWYTWHGYANCTGEYSREPDYRIDPDRAVYSAGFRCCWSEEAPTRAQLSDTRIAADAVARVTAAKEASSTADYDPGPEVPLGDGVFIDVFEYPNRPGEIPRAAVTWTEADQLCKDGGKRLCSASEWEVACAGSEALTYPYGNRYVRGACAVEAAERPTSGSAFACISPVGAQDMVGSVWEWTSDRLDAKALGDHGEVFYEIRGGSWRMDAKKAACRATDGYPVAPAAAELPPLGFRCCRGSSSVDPMAPRPGRLKCPDDMVSVAGDDGDYCIDRFEAPNQRGQNPNSHVAFAQAQSICREVGKHLCSESEWMDACAGPANRRWPYGNHYVPERCQDSANKSEHSGETMAASGTHSACATPEGVEDMSGNMWEWTVGAGGTGVLHGGGWNLSAGLNQCRSTASPTAGSSAPEFGVRCCATAAEAKKLR